MSHAIHTESIVPILRVRNFEEAMNYYTKSLLFERLWDWGNPPDFGAVRLGSVEIFFCLGDQGQSGTWLCIMIDDVDAYHAAVMQAGAEVFEAPADRPWGVREMLVRDPNAHVIRFGHGIPMRVPKLEIERIGIEARIEKRLAALAHELAARKGMSLGKCSKKCCCTVSNHCRAAAWQARTTGGRSVATAAGCAAGVMQPCAFAPTVCCDGGRHFLRNT